MREILNNVSEQLDYDESEDAVIAVGGQDSNNQDDVKIDIKNEENTLHDTNIILEDTTVPQILEEEKHFGSPRKLNFEINEQQLLESVNEKEGM